MNRSRCDRTGVSYTSSRRWPGTAGFIPRPQSKEIHPCLSKPSPRPTTIRANTTEREVRTDVETLLLRIKPSRKLDRKGRATVNITNDRNRAALGLGDRPDD